MMCGKIMRKAVATVSGLKWWRLSGIKWDGAHPHHALPVGQFVDATFSGLWIKMRCSMNSLQYLLCDKGYPKQRFIQPNSTQIIVITAWLTFIIKTHQISFKNIRQHSNHCMELINVQNNELFFYSVLIIIF